jgi:hypothetical protein
MPFPTWSATAPSSIPSRWSAAAAAPAWPGGKAAWRRPPIKKTSPPEKIPPALSNPGTARGISL